MSFLAWIVLGLLAGFIGSKIVNNTGQGVVLDIILGVVGAVIGGWLFNQFGASGVSGLNLYSLNDRLQLEKFKVSYLDLPTSQSLDGESPHVE